MIIYLYLLLCIIYFTLFGKATAIIFKVDKIWKHDLVLGFFTYIGLFFIVGIAGGVLDIKTVLYFQIQGILLIIYTLLALVVLIVHYWKHHLQLKEKLLSNIQQNWGIYLTIFIFITLYLLSSNSMYYQPDAEIQRYNLPLIDNGHYVSRVLRFLQAPTLNISQLDILTGLPTENPSAFLMLWEQLHSFIIYWSDLNIFVFLHTGVAIFGIIFIILSFDEMLHQLFVKRGMRLLHKNILSFSPLLLYIFSYHANETFKFLFFPWYGNIYVTIGFGFLFMSFLLLSLEKKQMLFYFIVLPLVLCGFSPGSATMALFYYPLGLYIWKKYKKYEMKLATEWTITTILVLIIILFGIASIIITLGSYQNIFDEGFRRSIFRIFEKPIFYTEQELWWEHLDTTTPIILLAVFTFLFRRKNHSAKYDKLIDIIFIYLSSIFFLALTPKISNVFFNVFYFSYRRVLTNISLILVVFSLKYLFDFLYQHYKKLWPVFLSLAIMTISLGANNGIFIQKERWFFQKDNITNLTRLDPMAVTVYEYFNALDDEKIVCNFDGLYDGRGFATEKGTVDYYLPVLAGKNSYIRQCHYDFDENEVLIDNMSDVNYVLIEAKNAEGIAYISSDFTYLDTLESNDRDQTLYVYSRK